jgi:GNAT superfamily N-acetyltransferase
MLQIRPWQSSDSVSELTQMLHRAYRPLAEAGLNFLASHQDDEMTLKRLSKGTCFVAESQGRIIATICYRRAGLMKGSPWYERPEVAYFGQFAVEPQMQRQGVGSMLLAHIEQQAQRDGAHELAFDTSEQASQLIDYYRRRGYRFIEYVKWDVVNYRSMLMSKTVSR